MPTATHKSTANSSPREHSGHPAPQRKSGPSPTGADGSEASADEQTTDRKPTAALELPFVSASVTLPRPGASLRVGPMSMNLPTGYLYYGGLGILAVAGTIEWPIAVTFAAGGLLVERIRARR